jgi:hypothetical protein
VELRDRPRCDPIEQPEQQRAGVSTISAPKSNADAVLPVHLAQAPAMTAPRAMTP